MKNFFDTTIRTLFLALLVVSSFVACSDDDDDEGPSKKVSGVYNASLTFSQDLINITDITLEYNDSTNTKVTETITTTTWNKKFTYKSLPGTALYSINFAFKASYPEKDEYDITFKRSISALLVEGGKTSSSGSYSINNVMTGIKKDKLANIINPFNESWKAVITEEGVKKVE